MTAFPVLHGKGLELSERRFQSRYLRESIFMLQFNTQEQKVRLTIVLSEINRTERDECGWERDGKKVKMAGE